MAWKDEAFELGNQWAQVYEPGSPSRKLITELMDSFFLVNVVHNDFKDTDAIFQSFYEAGAAASPAPAVLPHTKSFGAALVNGLKAISDVSNGMVPKEIQAQS